MSDADEGDRHHPRSTEKLIGHEAAEATLLGALSGGRMPPGWLITGPGGIGKATLAYRFARFMLSGRRGEADLFADAPTSLHVPPDHPVFRRVAAQSHGDLIAVEREASTGTGRPSAFVRVDQARAVVNFFHLTAGEGIWRVAIVDGADNMNPNAANALLKILEEPPEYALLLLTAAAPSRVTATIRSRCRHLALKPLGHEEVEILLSHRHPDQPADDCRAISALAAGSPGRAHDLVAAGGLDAYRELLAVLERAPDLDMVRLHALGDRLARKERQNEFDIWMELLGIWINRGIRGLVARSAPEVVAGEGALAARLLPRAGLDRWLDLWDKVARLARAADVPGLDRKQVVLAAFLAVAETVRG